MWLATGQESAKRLCIAQFLGPAAPPPQGTPPDVGSPGEVLRKFLIVLGLPVVAIPNENLKSRHYTHTHYW